MYPFKPIPKLCKPRTIVLQKWSKERMDAFLRKDEIEDFELRQATGALGDNVTIEEWNAKTQIGLEIQNMIRYCGMERSDDVLPEFEENEKKKEEKRKNSNNSRCFSAQSSLDDESLEAKSKKDGENLKDKNFKYTGLENDDFKLKEEYFDALDHAWPNLKPKTDAKAKVMTSAANVRNHDAWPNLQAKAKVMTSVANDRNYDVWPNLNAKTNAKAKVMTYASNIRNHDVWPSLKPKTDVKANAVTSAPNAPKSGNHNDSTSKPNRGKKNRRPTYIPLKF